MRRNACWDDTMERLTDNNVTDWGQDKDRGKGCIGETLFGRKQREDR